MKPIADTLRPYFADLESKDLFSGVVFITQGPTTLFAEAYGYASRAWKIKNTLETRFDCASVTKLFTAVATLQLIEQGKLALDMSVIDYLGISDTTISKAVTPFHLLTHSSGIADDADEEAGEAYEDLWKTKANYSVLETVDFLPQFIHKPPNFAPGAGCRYCNVSFVLLGLMIEKATGMSYRDYVRQHVFARAGMSRSDFFRMDRVSEDVAEGCDPITDESENVIGWKKNIYSYPPVGSPDGGAHVTAGDLLRFLRALQAGTMTSPELTQQMLSPHVFHSESDKSVMRCGFAFEFEQRKMDTLHYFHKDGFNVGVSANLRHYPSLDLSIAILSNRSDGAWKPLRHMHEVLVAATQP
ncbi:MAG: serine hydrolase domain-containing protein [Anaerolineae bacterium]